MIFKFNEFLKESVSEKHFNYYAFDVDDNILIMPTTIKMDKKVDDQWIPVDISTSQFAEVRTDSENWRLRNGDPEIAFSDFGDEGKRGHLSFVSDLRRAIKRGSFGPAWNDFIECLVNGSIFAIITARKHEPQSIRRGIEYIIDNYLNEDQIQEMYNNLLKFEYLYGDNDLKHSRILRSNSPSRTKIFRQYLSLCDYVGVGNEKLYPGGSANPEAAKEKALIEFSRRVSENAGKIGYTARIGFSDDDTRNVNKIENLVKSITKEHFPHIKEYVIKNTNDPKNIKVSKKIIEYVNPLSQSVISATTFGNMTSHLYPSSSNNRQDDFYHQHLKRVDYLRKINKDIVNDNEKEEEE